MTITALVLLLLGSGLAEPASRILAAARWTLRDPVGALLLWQAIGLTGGLAVLGAGLAFGLAPLGDSIPGAVASLDDVDELTPLRWVVLGFSALLAARLLTVLIGLVIRTVRARQRHRELLDVLADPGHGPIPAHVLDHPFPLVYCLPGLRRARVVVTAGALDALPPPELDAVLAHERAHLRERHDLVVLPFVAWAETARGVPGMRQARTAVAALVEMRADDVAAAECGPEAVLGALRTVRGSTDALMGSSFSAALSARLQRIEHGRQPLPLGTRIALRAGSIALVVLPFAVVM